MAKNKKYIYTNNPKSRDENLIITMTRLQDKWNGNEDGKFK